MMCCNRCGDILTSGKCRKCGGRAVASIIASNGLGSVRGASATANSTTSITTATTTANNESSQISIADKWQSQYENGILGSPHTVFDAKDRQQQQPSFLKGSTRTRRNSSPQGLMGKRSSLSLSLQTSCNQCSQRLRHDTPSFLENGLRYCKNCHTDLFSRGACSKCKKPVFPQRDTFVEHKRLVWHRDCFRCHGCQVALGDVPMVDLRGWPCCEPCLMAQSGEARQAAAGGRQVYDIAKLHHPRRDAGSAAGTPVLVKGSDTMSSAGSIFTPKTPPHARPRIDSQLFQHYQKSLQHDPAAAANRTSPPPPPLSPAGSIRSSVSGSPVSISPSSSPLSLRSSSSSSTASRIHPSPAPSPPASGSRPPFRAMASPAPAPAPASSGKRACAECNKPLQGTKIKMPSPSGDIWYHYDCLKCAGCRGHFTESKIVRLGNSIYHPECVPPSEPAEEHKYQCYTCEKPIKDKCVRNGSKYYHVECFQCRRCRKVLDHDRPFYEVQDEPHCDGCVGGGSNSNNNSPHPGGASRSGGRGGPPPSNAPSARPLQRMRGSTSTPLLPSHHHRSFDNNPSSLLMHRTRALPKLGGSKICPCCHTSIAIMDDIPGPKATRWHRKCLRCTGCKKQMDSGAKVSENSNGEWFVQCRGCMDKTGSTTKFVR